MPKLYSSSEILKVLQRHGFVYVSQNGSHIKYRKIGNPTLTVIIPADRKQTPSGTFHFYSKAIRIIKKMILRNSFIFCTSF